MEKFNSMPSAENTRVEAEKRVGGFLVTDFEPQMEGETAEEFEHRKRLTEEKKMMVAMVEVEPEALVEENFRMKRMERRKILEWVGKMNDEKFDDTVEKAVYKIETPMDRDGAEEIYERVKDDKYALRFIFAETNEAWKKVAGIDFDDLNLSPELQKKLSAVAIEAFYKKYNNAVKVRKAEESFLQYADKFPDYEDERFDYEAGVDRVFTTLYGAQEEFVRVAEDIREKGQKEIEIKQENEAAEKASEEPEPAEATPKKKTEEATVSKTEESANVETTEPEVRQETVNYPVSRYTARAASARARGFVSYRPNGSMYGATAFAGEGPHARTASARNILKNDTEPEEPKPEKEPEEEILEETELLANGKLRKLTPERVKKIIEELSGSLKKKLERIRTSARGRNDGSVEFSEEWPSVINPGNGARRMFNKIMLNTEGVYRSEGEQIYSLRGVELEPEVEFTDKVGKADGVKRFASKMFLMRGGRRGMYLFEKAKNENGEDETRVSALVKIGDKWGKVTKYVRNMGTAEYGGGGIDWARTEEMMEGLEPNVELNVKAVEENMAELGGPVDWRGWDDSEMLVGVVAKRIYENIGV